jgi:hypothetical protein
MALEPQFSISAANPAETGFRGAGKPYLVGAITSYGGYTVASNRYRLGDQYSNDELIIGRDPVDPADENDITNYIDELYRRNTYRLQVWAYDVRADHQFLFVFGFTNPALWPGPIGVQFFIGTEWVRSETFDDVVETVALLVDSPGDGDSNLNVFVRLAALSPSATIGLTGIEGFLI